MSYEEASQREIAAFEALQKAVELRGNVDANAAIYSDHREPYEASVEHVIAAIQAYDAASRDLMAARTEQTF